MSLRPTLCLAALLLALTGIAQAEQGLTIEHLTSEGWELAGYTGASDNRSSLLLFRHKDRKFLVQCAILYDVTRTPHTNVNCYELH